jgi:hypothetical protein
MFLLLTRPRMLALCAVLGLALSACDRQQVAHWLAPSDEDAAGRQYVEDIRARNFTPVRKDLAPSVRVSDEALLQLASFLNAGETPKSITLVTRDVRTVGGVTHYNLGYQYEFARDWRLIALNLEKTGSVTKIAGLHTFEISAPLQEVNAFRFRTKAPRHFIFLAAFIGMALFTIATAIVCWRTRMGRGKFLWLLIIFLGFGELAINWTSGLVYYDPVAIELFGVGFYRGLSGVWTLQIGLPVGAVLFWIFRDKLKAP